MKRSTGTKLVTACLDVLQRHGVTCWRNNTGAYQIGKRFVRFGHKGSGDILGLWPRRSRFPGLFFSVECKEGTGRPSRAQKEFKETIEASGGHAFVVRDLLAFETIVSLYTTLPGSQLP